MSSIYTDELSFLAFSQDGRHTIVTIDNRAVEVEPIHDDFRDRTTKAEPKDDVASTIWFRDFASPVHFASFSPDGKRIIAASGSARIWHIDAPTLLKYLAAASTECLRSYTRERNLRETREESNARNAACERRYGRAPR